MNLCIVSPLYNGLMKYTKPLVELLKKQTDFNILHIGFEDICFDIEKIKNQVERVAQKIMEFAPDIIHYNYGTYDSEQLLPYVLDKMGYKNKNILTYHSLQLDLFKKINCPELDVLSNLYMSKMDGVVFFTNYAKDVYNDKYSYLPQYIINFHPATHQGQKITKTQKKLYEKEFDIDTSKRNIALLGYASHWKETNSIVKLAETFNDVNFYIAGPYWQGKVIKENDKIDLSLIKNLKIIDKELNSSEFLFFVENCVGFFPYKYFKSFQGSGLLPNYLLNGYPCLVNDIRPLKEYCGRYKYCFDFSSQKLLEKKVQDIFEEKMFKKNLKFSYQNHLNLILNFYNEVQK